MSDRKYRQRGYHDDDRPPAAGRSGPAPPRPKPDGPRGRGLGAPTVSVFRCARCGHRQSPPEPIPFDAVCEKCRTDLHSCTNCRHFDTSAPNECRQGVTPRIAAKARANRCELFALKSAQETASDGGGRAPADPRAAFDALFKL